MTKRNRLSIDEIRDIAKEQVKWPRTTLLRAIQDCLDHLDCAQRDHEAMEWIRDEAEAGVQVRLSNKATKGFWWYYRDDVVAQGTDPADAILAMKEKS